jgi:hypothetical protein
LMRNLHTSRNSVALIAARSAAPGATCQRQPDRTQRACRQARAPRPLHCQPTSSAKVRAAQPVLSQKNWCIRSGSMPARQARHPPAAAETGNATATRSRPRGHTLVSTNSGQCWAASVMRIRSMSEPSSTEATPRVAQHQRRPKTGELLIWMRCHTAPFVIGMIKTVLPGWLEAGYAGLFGVRCRSDRRVRRDRGWRSGAVRDVRPVRRRPRAAVVLMTPTRWPSR